MARPEPPNSPVTVSRAAPPFQAAVDQLYAAHQQAGQPYTREQIEAAAWIWFSEEIGELLTDAHWFALNPASNHARPYQEHLRRQGSYAG